MNNPLNLYEHNRKSYEKIKNAFDQGKKVVGIVHATGTGKSYNALQLVLDNPNKKVIFIAPYNSILEHFEQIIKDHGLSLERDFSNLTLMNYQSLINLSREELSTLSIDLLILDEFHHIGAPVWGERVNYIIATHPDMQIFGMTAYTVRDRGTIYERDMANPDGSELFSNKIVSRYDILDAMLDGVLPSVIYRSVYIQLADTLIALEERVKNKKCSKEEQELYDKLLKDAKRRIEKALSLADMIKKVVGKKDKLIYFCPLGSNIEEIQEEAKKWFLRYIPEEDIVFYQTTNAMGEEGAKYRDAFYHDQTLEGKDATNKLRVMFCINQYNEGVHAPNVNGVIMGRETKSDIVFFEQLGRALSVRGDTKTKFEEYQRYSKDELVRLCQNKHINVYEDMSNGKMIEKLIAPYVIDLTNNIGFIKELENNIQNRVKERQKLGEERRRVLNIQDVAFDIEIVNEEIYEILRYVSEKLTMIWEDWYELARKYYEYHSNLNVPLNFKTTNGYDYDDQGLNLGEWIHKQRRAKKENVLSKDREEKLFAIGMIFDAFEEQWQEMYKLAKKYFEHYGNLNIPQSFKTTNGYDYDNQGFNLGRWIHTQRKKWKKGILSKDREEKLFTLGMKFDAYEDKWQEMYELAKKYFEHYGNLNIPYYFKTTNGYDYNDQGLNLGIWINNQRSAEKKGILSKGREEKLFAIGMKFDTFKEQWQKMYDLAKKYFEYYGNLNIPCYFKTTNGYDYDDQGFNLGRWINNQRSTEKKNILSKDREEKLFAIGMKFDALEDKWQEMYKLAKKYFEYHGNLNISRNFKTTNGYDYDDQGFNLGKWINTQRSTEKKGILSKDREEKLLAIGMKFDALENKWQEMYELAKKYFEYHDNLNIPYYFKTINGYDYNDQGLNLGNWINTQRKKWKKGILSEDREEKLLAIGMKFDAFKEQWQEMYELAKKYFEYHGNLNISRNFKTTNGYDYDDQGFNLGRWIHKQRSAKKENVLSKDREEKLFVIGMIFDTKKNTSLIKEVCQNYGIDEKKNNAILKGISYREMIVKIKYLEEKQISITNNGLLHEMFNISNQALQEKYGISLEELVKIYSLDLERGR